MSYSNVWYCCLNNIRGYQFSWIQLKTQCPGYVNSWLLILLIQYWSRNCTSIYSFNFLDQLNNKIYEYWWNHNIYFSPFALRLTFYSILKNEIISFFFRSRNFIKVYVWRCDIHLGPSPGSSGIDILITLDKVSSSWTRVNDTQYTVRNALLYEAINIRLRSLSLEQEESERTFKGTVPFSNKNISVVKIDRF